MKIKTRCSVFVLAGCLAAFWQTTAVAQSFAPGDTPGEQRPDLPEYATTEAVPVRVLPPLPSDLPLGGSREPGESPSLGTITISQFSYSGNTAFTDEQLHAIAAPFVGRPITRADLAALRDKVSATYRQAGYLTSFARIPSQTTADGQISIEIVEGWLSWDDLHIDIQRERSGRTQTGRLRQEYLERRIQLAAGRPLDVLALELALQLVQREEFVERLNAQLSPGSIPGEAQLSVTVEERNPLALSLELGNHQSPAIGAGHARATARFANPTGRGDRIDTTLRAGEGLRAWEFGYRIPVSARGAELSARAYGSRSEVVEAPFSDLDIRNRSATYAIGLRAPLRVTLRERSEMLFSAEYRHSSSSLSGSPFSFDEAADEGAYKLAILRGGHEWLRRGLRQVLAARTTISVGLNGFGATRHRAERADGQFLSWLTQLQWAQRLPRGIQIIARTDLQVANDSLPGLEKFALGGHANVRGYRENLLARDNGYAASVEARLPLFQRSAVRWELASFADGGRSWEDGASGRAETLLSVGLGLRGSFGDKAGLELYWAHALEEAPIRLANGLQDSGVHVRVWSAR